MAEGKDIKATAEQSQETSIKPNTFSVVFLGETIEIPGASGNDTPLILTLSQIEFAERYHGDGMIWLDILRENYHLRAQDSEGGDLLRKVEEIITKRKAGNG